MLLHCHVHYLLHHADIVKNGRVYSIALFALFDNLDKDQCEQGWRWTANLVREGSTGIVLSGIKKVRKELNIVFVYKPFLTKAEYQHHVW